MSWASHYNRRDAHRELDSVCPATCSRAHELAGAASTAFEEWLAANGKALSEEQRDELGGHVRDAMADLATAIQEACASKLRAAAEELLADKLAEIDELESKVAEAAR